MAMVYIPDRYVHEIMKLGMNKQVFVKEAIKEKLEKEIENDTKIL